MAAVALPLIFATSCLEEEDNYDDYAHFYGFAKVRESTVANVKYMFETDENHMLIPVNFPTTSELKLREGQRTMLYFNAVDTTKLGDPELDIKLFRLDTNVVIGATAFVSDQKELDAYANHSLEIDFAYNHPVVTGKYINLFVGYPDSHKTPHSFTLIHDSSNPGTSKTARLVLRHNSGDDLSYNMEWKWFSFPIEEFEEIIKDKDNIEIVFKTFNYGEQTIALRK